MCNSSANCWLDKISLLTAPPEVDLSCVAHVAKVYGHEVSERASEADSLPKNLTIEARPLGYPLCLFGFLAILNALSRNTLSEAVLLDKSLKYP